MLIGDKWKIEADEMNVILSSRYISKKKGTEVWRVRGYYSSPQEALHALIRQKVRDTELKDLKTIVAEIKRVEDMIATALRNATSHVGAV